MNSLLSSKDGYYQSTSLNVRSSQSTSPFNQLIDNLINNLFLYQSEDAKLSKELLKSDDLHKIFDKIEEIINQQYPQNKRSNALAILSTARTIFLHLIFLRNGCEPREILAQQIESVLDALQQTTKYSHDQFYGPVKALENRKLQISLGLVEALTEMLVLDIELFGIQLDGYEKCSKLRRSIGNSLMNLVYQQREAKHKLCANQKFLHKIAEIIVKTNPLVQFYAGLIQNISYNADQRIASQISITVHPLVWAAVQTAYENDTKFDLTKMQSQRRQNLLKILSALWNLAEDPVENKHVMCNLVPQFVPLLLKIMFSDQRELPFIQAAAGILKHLCTFILQYPDLFAKIHKKGILFAFIRQFSSSSPDLVTDSINALCILSSYPFIAREILTQETYIQQINYLVRSTNEGISRASRTLLDTIYSASIFYQFKSSGRPAEMCCNSMDQWSTKQQINEPINQHLRFVNYSSTLPRTFQQQYSNSKQQIHFTDDQNILNTPKGVLKQQNQSGSGDWQLPDEIHKNQMENNKKLEEEEISNAFIDEPSAITGGGQDLPTSVQCTREVSPRSCSFNSINNDEKNGWNSVQSTSVRSSGMQSSRASASELPDSPSQWATQNAQKVFQLKEMEMQILKALDENKQSGQCTNANVSGETENNQNQANDEPAENEEGRMLEEEEIGMGGLAQIEEEEIPCLLTQVIRDYMPKPGQNVGQIPHFNPTQNSTPILTPISCNSPCKSPTIRNETTKRRKGGHQHFYGFGGGGDLLDQSIAAVMPPHRLFVSRNTSGGSLDNSNSLNLMKHNNSEDDDLDGQIQEEISANFPVDIAKEIEAQIITVDCEKISASNKNEKCSSSSTEKNSQQQKEKLRSPQKMVKSENCWSKTKKIGPPPLAPKPKLIQPQKVKRSPAGSSNGGKGSNESKSSNGQTTKIQFVQFIHKIAMNAQQQQQAAYAAYQQYQAQAFQYAQQQQSAAAISNQQTNQKYKSTLCNIWLMEGVCARGRMCHYAHGIRELNYSQYYNFWMQQQAATGASPNSATAAASSTAMRPELFGPQDYQNRFYKTALCQFWQQRGVCNNGDTCRWAHGEEELRKPDQNGSAGHGGNGNFQLESATSDVMIGPQLDDSSLIGPHLPQMSASTATDGQQFGAEGLAGNVAAMNNEVGGNEDKFIENGNESGRKRKCNEMGAAEEGKEEEGENAKTAKEGGTD